MSLPSAEAIIRGYDFLARRLGLVDRAISERGVRAALSEAAELAAGDPANEPAALFFAVARRPRITSGAWWRLALILAENHALAVGLALAVDPIDARALATGIASRATDWPGTRSWFAARLVAGGP